MLKMATPTTSMLKMATPTTSIEDGTAPPTPSNEKSVEWLVKPLVDKQAPLILRANCIRSLALLTASSRDQRIRLQKGKGETNPSNLSQTILDVQSSVDNAVQPFLSDATSLGARVSSVTHLHSFNLLALAKTGEHCVDKWCSTPWRFSSEAWKRGTKRSGNSSRIAASSVSSVRTSWIAV